MEENKNITTLDEQQNKVLFQDVCSIIEQGRQQAYANVGQIVIYTYWNVGRRIVEEEQGGQKRASYGTRLMKKLAEDLIPIYGTSYSKRNLDYYKKFYLLFPEAEKVNTCVHNLEWSHVRRVLSVTSPEARWWYLENASKGMWSVRELDRNISSQYFERRLAAQLPVNAEDLHPTIDKSPLEYIKNPVVAEFMGFRRNSAYSESELEQALIDNLEKFILELGRGFAFVERQQHIVTQTSDFYIDLVFYNFKMKRFVIFELKTHRLTHQDIGQLDMYVRMYDDLVKGDDDQPTIGVLLCTDTDNTIARYSVLNDSDQLFAAKYMTYMPSFFYAVSRKSDTLEILNAVSAQLYMPTQEELRREIEQQKEFFRLQHKND